MLKSLILELCTNLSICSSGSIMKRFVVFAYTNLQNTFHNLTLFLKIISIIMWEIGATSLDFQYFSNYTKKNLQLYGRVYNYNCISFYICNKSIYIRKCENQHKATSIAYNNRLKLRELYIKFSKINSCAFRSSLFYFTLFYFLPGGANRDRKC